MNIRDVVSKLSAVLDEIERRELNHLGEREVRWELFADFDPSDNIRATCFCDAEFTGTEEDVNTRVDEHLKTCRPTPDLRLCLAHRRIIASYYHWVETAEGEFVDATIRTDTLEVVIRELAVGFGIPGVN